MALYSDLQGIDANQPVQWPIGLVFNALLDQAKQDYGDDPVIGAIAPVEENAQYVYQVNAGTLRAMVGQLMGAYAADAGPGVA